MSRRTRTIKTFTPQNQKSAEAETTDRDMTARKLIWSPPPSIQTLISKVEHVEERLDHLETIICQNTDPVVKEQEQREVDQSRQELDDMRRQLDDAVERLQQREAELQETQTALDNLTNQTAIDRDRIKALEAEKKELHQLVSDLESKLNERVKKVGRLEKQVADMQQCLKRTTNQITMLQQQMLQMQQQMNNIAGGNAVPVAAASANPAALQPTGYTQASQGAPQHWPANMPQPQIVAESPRQEPKPESAPRHHTGSLGLPPIALPSGSHNGGKNSPRGNVKFNFPPKKK